MRKIDRFDKYLAYKGLNDNKVTVDLGISIGTIGKSRKENRDLSSKIIEKILNFYTDLNSVWLLTGEGEMLKASAGSAPSMPSSDGATTVLLLPVSAQGGSLNDFVLSVKESDCVKVISPIRGADFAMQVTGDSMSPEYPNGSYIFIKRINEKAFIDWGKTYVLDTCNGLVIKCIVPSDKEGYIRCVSINTEPKYAPFDVALSDIFGIYKVLLCMSIK